MATKTAKFMLNDVVKENKETTLKERALKALEQAYIAGYDLAVKGCNEDGSKAGFTMAEFLETWEE